MLKISILITSLLLFGCGTGGIGGGSSKDDVQYAALGASDATGIGADPFTKGYVYLIKDDIENAGMSTNLMNYGVPDIEIGGIRDIELKLLDIGQKPDLVTLFIGGNDIIAGAKAERFELDLAAILNHVRKIDGVKLFMADLPNMTQLPRFKETPDADVTIERLNQFNQIIYRQAKQFNVTVIKLSEESPDDNIVASDGLHPNNQGYRRMADLFLQEILPAL